MEFIPEEFKTTILLKISKFETKLPKCNIQDYLEAFNLLYNMIYMGFDIYITLSLANNLSKCEVDINNENEKLFVERAKSFTNESIKSLEEKIEKDKRRILN